MPDRFALYPVDRAHLATLTDEVAIVHRAIGPVPDPTQGYRTADVVAALRVDLLHRRTLGWDAVSASATRNMRFLDEAFDRSTGSFRETRAAGGRWESEAGSEACHADVLLILGEMISDVPDDALLVNATFLFERALPAALRLTTLRARSAAFIGCDTAMRANPNGTAASACRNLGAKIQVAFLETPMTADWPWPEPVVGDGNALLVRAALAAGRYLDDPDLVAAAIRGLDWLIEIQTQPNGVLSPIGDTGWPRDGVRPRFDQRPVDATALLVAAETAFRLTADERYREAMERAYGWFLGQNDVGVPVADPDQGACFDRLTAEEVSPDQGAEATLMWLTALEVIRAVRGNGAGGSPAVAGQLSGVASR